MYLTHPFLGFEFFVFFFQFSFIGETFLAQNFMHLNFRIVFKLINDRFVIDYIYRFASLNIQQIQKLQSSFLKIKIQLHNFQRLKINCIIFKD